MQVQKNNKFGIPDLNLEKNQCELCNKVIKTINIPGAKKIYVTCKLKEMNKKNF